MTRAREAMESLQAVSASDTTSALDAARRLREAAEEIEQAAAADARWVGATWTDAVVIEGEDRCVAMRYRTRGGSELIVPCELGWRREGPGLVAELPGEAGAVCAATAAVRMCSPSCSSCPALEPGYGHDLSSACHDRRLGSSCRDPRDRSCRNSDQAAGDTRASRRPR